MMHLNRQMSDTDNRKQQTLRKEQNRISQDLTSVCWPGNLGIEPNTQFDPAVSVAVMSEE